MVASTRPLVLGVERWPVLGWAALELAEGSVVPGLAESAAMKATRPMVQVPELAQTALEETTRATL